VDGSLIKAITEMNDGLIDAELGGGFLRTGFLFLGKENEVAIERLLLLKRMIKHFLFTDSKKRAG
jgi:hypothetical protein